MVGSPPPPPTWRRQDLLSEIIRLKADGHAVEVAALDRLATAHRYLAGPGILCALDVAFAARRHDAVIVQLEPGLPVRERAGRSERALSLLGLAFGLRRCRDVTVRLGHLDDLPGGFGGRAALGLWKVASRIEAGDAAVAAAVSSVLGDGADRLQVPVEDRKGAILHGDAAASNGSAGLASARPREAWGEIGAVSAGEVVTVVRRNAAAERRVLADRGLLPSSASDGLTRVPQWEWLPSPGACVPDLGVPRRRADSPGSTGSTGAVRRLVLVLLRVAERNATTRLFARSVLDLRAQLRSGPAGDLKPDRQDRPAAGGPGRDRV
ncbi:MAG: hypothetical protein ACRDZ5_01240 [Acidimicrobiales bacterium]